MAERLDSAAPDFAHRFAALLRRRRDQGGGVAGQVAELIADVAERGDAAVVAATRRFDHLDLPAEKLRFTPDEIDQLADACPSDVADAIDLAAARITAFHDRQKPQPIHYTDDAGVTLGQRWTPIDAVGIYVPGGQAAYPSSVLMNALPARVAGVGRIAMCVPTPYGQANPAVLAAARAAGVTEIWRVGGVQAVAAMALGTALMAPVDKVVGPGNAYVAEAKRQLFGKVGIDMVAGPSEVCIIADSSCDPDWLAADLMAQAEHDAAAQSILMTDDAALADAVAAAVARLLEDLPRADLAGQSWRDHGAIIKLGKLSEAAALVDQIAPEHLQLAVARPALIAADVRHAGAIFLGPHTPEAVGDYVAGPNHVLPTGGTARFASGLGVLDFMKRTTLVGCDKAALERIGPAAVTLARAEGLEAHARSIAKRLGIDV